MFAKPHTNTRGFARIQDSYANPIHKRGFAKLSGIFSTPRTFRWDYVNTEKKSSITCIKCFSKIIQQLKGSAAYLPLDGNRFSWYSYFSRANQNAPHMTNQSTNQARFVFWHNRATYSHLNTPIDQWESAYYPNYFVKYYTFKTL